MQVDALLDKMVGRWSLTGKMGNIELKHLVTAEWVLQNRFLKMHTIDAVDRGDGRRYEAVYYIGHDAEKDRFVMHLIDVFGAGFSETLGFGCRVGQHIVFEFAYKQGPFRNTMAYDTETDSWDMELVSQGTGGEWKLFAHKRLTRCNS